MLTQEQSEQLKQPFAVSDHEWLQGNAYITENAITNRLDEVDPSWEFNRLEIYPRDNQIIATYRLTVSGVSRDGVGMAVIQLSKDKAGNPTGREVNEAEKSAATDALKRAARLFGIGRYILSFPKWVKDDQTLSQWFSKNGTPSPQNATSSDFQPEQASYIKTSQNSAKTPTNGKNGISGDVTKNWNVNRNNILADLNRLIGKQFTHEQRGDAVNYLHSMESFTGVETVNQAVQLVIDFLNEQAKNERVKAEEQAS